LTECSTVTVRRFGEEAAQKGKGGMKLDQGALAKVQALAAAHNEEDNEGWED